MSTAIRDRRTCVVLGFNVRDAAIPVEVALSAIRSVYAPQLGLVWHDVVRRPHNADPEAEADVIAVCSVFAAVALEETALLGVVAAAPAGKVLADGEVWLTAPCRVPLFTGTPADLDCGCDAKRGLALLRRYGMTTMEGAVETAAVEILRAAAERYIDVAEAAVAAARPGLRLGADEFTFAEFSSRGGPRFDLLLPPEGDERWTPALEPFARLARAGPWVPLVKKLLGPEYRCAASLIYSRPGAEAQDWHTDGAHLGRDADWDGKGGSPPYALCVFVPLIDLDRRVGFTQFWPGTHAYSGLLGFGSVAPLLGSAVDALLPAGGAVIYDYRTAHRGMPNASEATLRPLVQLLYHLPSYSETKNYGHERVLG